VVRVAHEARVRRVERFVRECVADVRDRETHDRTRMRREQNELRHELVAIPRESRAETLTAGSNCAPRFLLVAGADDAPKMGRAHRALPAVKRP
jgi:hypothetical protein